MPVAITFEDDFALHEDAADWEYHRADDYGPYIVTLVDEYGDEIGVDAIVNNMTQISHLTQEEYREVLQGL